MPTGPRVGDTIHGPANGVNPFSRSPARFNIQLKECFMMKEMDSTHMSDIKDEIVF